MSQEESLREANCGIVRRYIDMINAWDFDGMRQILADNMVFEMPFTPPSMPNRLEGREALIEYQQKISKVILSENLHNVWLDTLHSDPAEVIAEYESDMKLADPSLHYSNKYIGRFTVKNGLIYRFQECMDTVRAVNGFGGKVELTGGVLTETAYADR